jgi:hypothetical protein
MVICGPFCEAVAVPDATVMPVGLAIAQSGTNNMTATQM